MALASITADDFRVKDEKPILFLSLAVLAFVFVAILGISLGLILIVLAVAVLWIKVRQGQLLGNAVRVTLRQLPQVYEAAKDASDRLGMATPDVFVTQNPTINAFALGFLGRKSVVLNSATVEAMEPGELRTVLGHEFAHIKCDHTNWMVFTSINDAIRIPVISDILGLILLLWSRKAEYTADRAGLLASRDLKASVSALAKVAVGQQLCSSLDLDALLEQRGEIGIDDVAKLSERLSDHPYIVNRIHALREFWASPLFARLAGIPK